MPGTVTLIRSAQLSDVAEYAYAATAPMRRTAGLPRRGVPAERGRLDGGCR